MPRFDRRLAPTAILLALPYVLTGVWMLRHQSALAAGAYLAGVIATLMLLAWMTTTWRGFFLCHAPLFIASAVFAAYLAAAGLLPGDSIAYVLATSSWDEVVGFFELPQEQRLLFLYVALVLLYVWLACCVPPARVITRLSRMTTTWGVIASVAALVLCAACTPEQFFTGISVTPVAGSAMFVLGPLAAANTQVHGNHVRKLPYRASRAVADEVHVLIIGESSRRDSWSIYGYARETTPYLASIRQELILFMNAKADSNSTVLAVPMLLTGIDPEHYDIGSVRGNLVDLAKEAGYHTSWLVNQDAHISNLVGMDADESSYPHLISENATRELLPDGTLLADLARQLSRNGQPLFIGMHVDGSHWAYFDRYPATFERFGPGTGLTFASLTQSRADRRMLDTYDNSIAYTDWFLQQVIEAVRALDRPATVTYLSDHGESLYALDGRVGHGWPEYEASEFDIPAFVWVNDAFRLMHPDKTTALTLNASKEIRSHDFFFGVADIMGIGWPGLLPRYSFASPQFLPDTRDRHIAGGKLVERRD